MNKTGDYHNAWCIVFQWYWNFLNVFKIFILYLYESEMILYENIKNHNICQIIILKMVERWSGRFNHPAVYDLCIFSFCEISKWYALAFLHWKIYKSIFLRNSYIQDTVLNWLIFWIEIRENNRRLVTQCQSIQIMRDLNEWWNVLSRTESCMRFFKSFKIAFRHVVYLKNIFFSTENCVLRHIFENIWINGWYN